VSKNSRIFLNGEIKVVNSKASELGAKAGLKVKDFLDSLK